MEPAVEPAVESAAAPAAQQAVEADLDGVDTLHVDLDAFYVEVERLANEELVGKPVVVGGPSNRGVVASASYEARAFGVGSAMPTAQARRLCPHAVFITSNFAAYAAASAAVFEVLGAFTPAIEPIALDEAFLDVSGAHSLFGTSVDIAWRLRDAVRSATGLTTSVGVAPTKTIAKLASVAAKPVAVMRNGVGSTQPGLGVKVVDHAGALAFLRVHRVRALWGVGPKTQSKLAELGVATIGDLANVPLEALTAAVGRAHGEHLAALARGEDARPVVSTRQAKSIGHEQTFATDLTEPDEMRSALVVLADAVAARLRASGVAGRCVQLKVKLADFRLITRVETVPAHSPAVSAHQPIAQVVHNLLERIDVSAGVRLLGVSVSQLEPMGAPCAREVETTQPTLFDEPRRDVELAVRPETELAGAIDAIRQRFGATSIGPGLTRHTRWLE